MLRRFNVKEASPAGVASSIALLHDDFEPPAGDRLHASPHNFKVLGTPPAADQSACRPQGPDLATRGGQLSLELEHSARAEIAILSGDGCLDLDRVGVFVQDCLTRTCGGEHVKPSTQFGKWLTAQRVDPALTQRVHYDQADTLEDLEMLCDLRLAESEPIRDLTDWPRGDVEEFDDAQPVALPDRTQTRRVHAVSMPNRIYSSLGILRRGNAMEDRQTTATGDKIRIERIYDTSAQTIWRLWTAAEGIQSWWAPDGFTVKVVKLDLKPRGELVYTMTATGPEQITFMRGAGMPLTTESRKTFTEVVEPRRIAYLSLVDFVPDHEPYEFLTVVDLEQIGERTKVVMTVDRMHDEVWTGRLVAGRENELENLRSVIAAAH